MKTSKTTTEIIKAIQKFQETMGKIKKDKTNPYYNSKYADLSSILDAIQKPLKEAELSFVQFPCSESEGNRMGLETRLLHASGEWMSQKFFMNPVKSDPQAGGSCLTYMRRYALSAVLGLNTEEDDDGNAASEFWDKKEKTNSSDYVDTEKKPVSRGWKVGFTYPEQMSLAEQKKLIESGEYGVLSGVRKDGKGKWHKLGNKNGGWCWMNDALVDFLADYEKRKGKDTSEPEFRPEDLPF